jgi:hypothetical protein
MTINKEDIKRIKQNPDFQAFVSYMFYENCDERETYHQEPYADVNEYLKNAQSFLIRTFLKS